VVLKELKEPKGDVYMTLETLQFHFAPNLGSKASSLANNQLPKVINPIPMMRGFHVRKVWPSAPP